METNIETEYGLGPPLGKSKIKKQKATKNQNERDETDAEASIEAATLTSSLMGISAKAGKHYYGVSIMNGKQIGAGTSAPNVFICLVGQNGNSGKLRITDWLSIFGVDSIHRDTWDNLIIESSEDLGEILVVILGIDKGNLLKDPWYVNEVGIYNFQSKNQQAFPCYHWIQSGTSVSFTSKTATVKDDNDSEVLLNQRKVQLKKRQNQYRWKKFPDIGLPSCFDDTQVQVFGLENKLPEDEQFQRVKLVDFTGTALKDGAKLLLQSLATDLTCLNDYEKLATALGTPEVSVHNAARWTTDVEFGRQMLNGVNPVVIKRCTKLPNNFPVTNEMVKGSLNRGKSLDEEMEDGHVYICNLKIMDGLPMRHGQFSTAPICLLYVNASSQLVPIAIQLKQEGKDNPIFLPSDHLIDWLLAKIYYQSAHAQYHQLSTHYYSCHAAMEAYSMATMRHLPDPHPIYKLLRPHFRYTMAINTAARATLVNDGGIIDRLFAIGGDGKLELWKRVAKHYRVQWTNIVHSVKERGVDDPEKLPGYYYRDDGVKVWRAMEKLVSRVVDEFYKRDQDVYEDPELQQWAKDIHKNAFPADDIEGAEEGHGFPEEIKTKNELTEFCTLIMFTGSAQHASINFGQYDMYAFIPNATYAVRRPPPSKKGARDYTDLLSTLPDKNDTANQIAMSNLLSMYSEDEIYLGTYPSGMFTEKTPQRLIERFQEDLDDIAGDILQRNKGLDVPYTYMLPRKIPNSITI